MNSGFEIASWKKRKRNNDNTILPILIGFEDNNNRQHRTRKDGKKIDETYGSIPPCHP